MKQMEQVTKLILKYQAHPKEKSFVFTYGYWIIASLYFSFGCAWYFKISLVTCSICFIYSIPVATFVFFYTCVGYLWKLCNRFVPQAYHSFCYSWHYYSSVYRDKW